MKNPRNSENSPSRGAMVSHMMNETDASILRKHSDTRLATPLRSVNKSFGSMSVSLSGVKDVAMAETKARDVSPEIQKVINVFGVQPKYTQEDDALSKIKWRNPYKKELDSIMKPKMIAATKIQRKYRAWIQHVWFKRYIRAIIRIQVKQGRVNRSNRIIFSVTEEI